MDIIIALLIGLAIGILTAYLIANRRYTALRIMSEATATSLHHTTVDLQGKNEQVLRLQAENRHLNALSISQENEISLLKEQNAAETRLRNEQFQEQLNVVREQFHNLAAHVLSKTSDRLKDENREAMEHITKPIGDSFAELQKAIIESDREAAKTAASLTERLRQVGEQAERMDRTATRLTNALRGDSKQAGDWGELVLQELLDSQGFKRGKVFFRRTRLQGRIARVFPRDACRRVHGSGAFPMSKARGRSCPNVRRATCRSTPRPTGAFAGRAVRQNVPSASTTRLSTCR